MQPLDPPALLEAEFLDNLGGLQTGQQLVLPTARTASPDFVGLEPATLEVGQEGVLGGT